MGTQQLQSQQLQERVGTVPAATGKGEEAVRWGWGEHHSRIAILNPNDHQTQRLRLWEGEVGWVQWAGRGCRTLDSLPHSENPKAKILVWLWAPFPEAPGFRQTGLPGRVWGMAPRHICFAVVWAQLSRVPRKGGGLIHCSPGCFLTMSEVSLSHLVCSGRRLTLFSVLAGKGRMPKAGGLQGAPVAPVAGLPATLSSIATATGNQTAAASTDSMV